MIPKPLRDRLGLVPGDVEVTADGAALRVEPVMGEGLERRGAFLVIPSSGTTVTDDDVLALRDADRR